MSSPGWLQAGTPHVWRPYCQHQTAPEPLPVAAAQGSSLYLEDGRRLVDGIASWWTAAHGYGAPHLVHALETQAKKLAHVAFGGLAHEPAYTLAARLTALLPPSLTRVFFLESGSVSVEVALKMALQGAHNRGQTRRKVIAFEGAYHGDTFATMALADPVDGMHRAFQGYGVEAVHLPVPRADDGGAFEVAFARHAAHAAAAIIEPLVQCAGGMRFHDAAALQRLRAACTEHGVLLIFDEIATGFYRVGPRFALEAAGVVPDILTLGKALSGGTVPLAATIASESVFSAFLGDDPLLALQHGPTYMANALACAAAHASLDLFEREDYATRVRTLESSLRLTLAPLRARPQVRDVRVRGAVAVVEMEPGSAPSSADFAARGAFIRPLRLRNADVVYLMPPLTIEAADLDVLTTALGDTLSTG